jgi:ABC-type amino acid transport substrate-binding protein
VDGVILDESPSHAYVDKNKLQLTMQNLEGSSFGAAIVFPKDSKLVGDFNRALAHLKETGELDEITKKWHVRQ